MSGEALKTMNTTTHPSSLFILGITLGLERIQGIVPNAPANLKAFLFDFSEHEAWKYTTNLFSFTHQLDLHDMWIENCITAYQDDSVREYTLIREQAGRMFRIDRKIQQESSFKYSTIRPEFKRDAEIGRAHV